MKQTISTTSSNHAEF